MGNKQHTVPACYLANFGIDGNKGRNSTIYFLNIETGEMGTISVDAILYQNHFYDVPELMEKSQILEDLFSHIEGDYARLLRKLLQNIFSDNSKGYVISSNDKELLSAQFAIQQVRTEDYRNFYKYIYKQLKEGLPRADIPDYKKKDFRRLHTQDLINFNSANFYANMFADRDWIFLINCTDLPFITSDNPIISIYEKLDSKGISAAAPEVMYYISLSPKLAVVMVHKDLKKGDCCWNIHSADFVRLLNRQLCKQCTRFLLSNVPFVKRGEDPNDET